jgi:hypothetical protein
MPGLVWHFCDEAASQNWQPVGHRHRGAPGGLLLSDGPATCPTAGSLATQVARPTTLCGRLACFSYVCFMALESRLGSRLHRTCMKLTNSTSLASVASDCIIQLYKGRDLLLVGWTRLLRRCRRNPVNSTGQCNRTTDCNPTASRGSDQCIL